MFNLTRGGPLTRFFGGVRARGVRRRTGLVKCPKPWFPTSRPSEGQAISGAACASSKDSVGSADQAWSSILRCAERFHGVARRTEAAGIRAVSGKPWQAAASTEAAQDEPGRARPPPGFPSSVWKILRNPQSSNKSTIHDWSSIMYAYYVRGNVDAITQPGIVVVSVPITPGPADW